MDGLVISDVQITAFIAVSIFVGILWFINKPPKEEKDSAKMYIEKCSIVLNINVDDLPSPFEGYSSKKE